jgi:hypothetical protein
MYNRCTIGVLVVDEALAIWKMSARLECSLASVL